MGMVWGDGVLLTLNSHYVDKKTHHGKCGWGQWSGGQKASSILIVSL